MLSIRLGLGVSKQWEIMRIISDIKDYYDSAQAYGQDARLVYLRKEQVVSLPSASYSLEACDLPPELNFVDALARSCPAQVSWRPGWPVRQVTIGSGWVLFAGKLYPFALVYQENTGVAQGQTHYFYGFDDLAKYLAPFGYDLTKKRASWCRPDGLSWGEFFSQVGSDRYYESCAQARAPVLLYYQGNSTLYRDTILAPYKFYKALDAWQAYQELSMFVGMLGSPEKPLEVIEDKYRVIQHGFDEWSFRKLPAKKSITPA